MSWLLDTNIVSELSKPQPDPKCQAWLATHTEECFISSVVVAELRYGIERLTDGKNKAEHEKDYTFLLENFRGRFYEFDGPSAYEWGRYAAELEAQYGTGWWKQFDLRDTEVAAIAREYGLTIATRNEKHFPFCRTENPFNFSGIASSST
jgi:toxin FitB